MPGGRTRRAVLPRIPFEHGAVATAGHEAREDKVILLLTEIHSDIQQGRASV